MAERRLGQMMAEQPKAQGGGANQDGSFEVPGTVPTLASQGIDKGLAHRTKPLVRPFVHRLDRREARSGGHSWRRLVLGQRGL